jgi:exopolysaccharide biosynthesis polyprenyl glycosylphosphotransferase
VPIAGIAAWALASRAFKGGAANAENDGELQESPLPDPQQAPSTPGLPDSSRAGARGANLRLARPEAASRATQARLARAARMIHALLIFATAANVTVLGAGSALRGRDIVAALVCGAAFLVSFRVERRNVTFARLSNFAQTIYRLKAVARGTAVMAAIGFAVPQLGLSLGRVLTVAGALVVVAWFWGLLTRRLLGATAIHRVLVVGDGEKVGRFIGEFSGDPHPQYEIVGLLTETGRATPTDMDEDVTLSEIVEMFDQTTSTSLNGARVLGSLDDLESVLAAELIDTVVVSVRRNRLDLFSRLSAYPGNITVQELPDFSERVFGRVPIDVINAAWFMHMIHPFYRPYSRAVKRMADVVAALFALALFAPVIPFAMLAVKLTSRGPIFYSQTRVGEHGREFRIHKFRTMRTDAEAAGPQWAQKRDPRVTKVGHLFRTTRIDEVPQLWNILCGHMSFVGPRPERPEFVSELEREVAYYQRRHLVKPGLTGWAQVRLGYADSVEGAASKLGYELYYLKHQSLFLDFVIFVETFRVVLLRFGSR